MYYPILPIINIPAPPFQHYPVASLAEVETFFFSLRRNFVLISLSLASNLTLSSLETFWTAELLASHNGHIPSLLFSK